MAELKKNVIIRDEFPLEHAREVLKDETIAVIGYGVQGPGQSMNLRDNGFNVIVGQRQGQNLRQSSGRRLEARRDPLLDRGSLPACHHHNVSAALRCRSDERLAHHQAISHSRQGPSISPTASP